MAPVVNKKQQKQIKKGNIKVVNTEENENSEEQIDTDTDDEAASAAETDEGVGEEEAVSDVEEAASDVEDAASDVEDAASDVEDAASDLEEAASDVEEAASDEEDEVEGNHEFDLNMSDSSSSDGQDDLDEEEDEDEAEQEDDAAVPTPSKEENIRKKIQSRYEQAKGKRLYVRFPEKLPAEEDKLQAKAKALSPLITEVHRPRQKHARFCLVDFATQADRDNALTNIKKNIKQSTDENFKKIVIDLPRTEAAEFVQNLVEKKLKTLEKKRANRKLKKIGVAAEKAKKYTSTLVVTNLPKRTSVLEVRTAFTTAIDVRIKRNKAAVTFPTTFDARKAYKQPPSISGIQLKVRFDKLKPRKRKPQLKKETETVEQSEQVAESTVKKSKKRTLPKAEETTETTVLEEPETSKKRLKKTNNAASAETKSDAKASTKVQMKMKKQTKIKN